MKLTRRNFLLNGTMATGIYFLPSWAVPQNREDPHFFVFVMILGGLDPIYLADARPMEMTRNNWVHNYLGEEPGVYTGSNNQTTRVTRIFQQNLGDLASDIAIVNGVAMNINFDGHDQNTAFLMTGDSFGGEYFVPHLNIANPQLLDALQTKEAKGIALSNSANVVTLDYPSLYRLVENIKSGTQLDLASPVWKFVMEQYEAGGSFGGRFGNSSQRMFRALPLSQQLEKKLLSCRLPEPGGTTDPDAQFQEIVKSFFALEISRSVIYQPNFMDVPVDTHAPELMKRHPSVVERAARIFRGIINILKNTPFDRTRSLFDLTTVMMTSEFSRSLRQQNLKIDATGTDHNSLSNTFLLAGKGIRGGVVLGETDFASSSEELSPAHLALDPNRIKVVGRPYDFDTGKPVLTKPDAYKETDYISAASIINTVYSLFGVDSKHYRKVGRTGVLGPVLKHLLK